MYTYIQNTYTCIDTSIYVSTCIPTHSIHSMHIGRQTGRQTDRFAYIQSKTTAPRHFNYPVSSGVCRYSCAFTQAFVCSFLLTAFMQIICESERTSAVCVVMPGAGCQTMRDTMLIWRAGHRVWSERHSRGKHVQDLVSRCLRVPGANDRKGVAIPGETYFPCDAAWPPFPGGQSAKRVQSGLQYCACSQAGVVSG